MITGADDVDAIAASLESGISEEVSWSTILALVGKVVVAGEKDEVLARRSSPSSATVAEWTGLGGSSTVISIGVDVVGCEAGPPSLDVSRTLFSRPLGLVDDMSARLRCTLLSGRSCAAPRQMASCVDLNKQHLMWWVDLEVGASDAGMVEFVVAPAEIAISD